MKTISNETLNSIIEHLLLAPESFINNDIKTNIKNFKGTNLEKYNFIISISKMESVNVVVKELCALDKYYLKP